MYFIVLYSTIKKAMCQKNVLLFGTLDSAEETASAYTIKTKIIPLFKISLWYNTDKTPTSHCSIPKINLTLSIPFSLSPNNF